MTLEPSENLFKIIEARREEMIELVWTLIRFPTINPPGEAWFSKIPTAALIQSGPWAS